MISNHTVVVNKFTVRYFDNTFMPITYLRSTLMEKRSNGLEMTNVNKKELVKVADGVQMFAQNARRMMQEN